MELLIITQKVNIDDPILGFFHRWIVEFSKHCESIVVICLEKGRYELPDNVRVLSLGKEEGGSRLKYVWRFYKYIWQERRSYDSIFVHMNQEYILLGGIFWKLFGKRIFMWRNHHAGSWLTDIAAAFCNKVFCTSKFSYTAKYKKTVLMPVGIDTDTFKVIEGIKRIPRSILFLSRMSPVKKPNVLIEALCLMKDQDFTASFYGDPLPKDEAYYQNLKDKVKMCGLESKVSFYSGVPNYKTPEIYNQHEVFINLSSSGMFDKTIFEAMACGCVVFASNNNLKGEVDGFYIVYDNDAKLLSERIMLIINTNKEGRGNIYRSLVMRNGLKKLGEELKKYETSINQ